MSRRGLRLLLGGKKEMARDNTALSQARDRYACQREYRWEVAAMSGDMAAAERGTTMHCRHVLRFF